MRTTACIPALALALAGQGQNLVPNPSFEDYNFCPNNFGQWTAVVGWDSPYTMSADYFNACAGGTICGIPFNHFGYQYPAHGDAYMGLATFANGQVEYREIITAELTEPLEIGVPVHMSMKVATGGFGSWEANSADWVARGPGIKFFVQMPSDWQWYFSPTYPNSAALTMDTVLSDTLVWTALSGSYVPDSAYRYIAITNFFEDALSWPMLHDSLPGFPFAYAFIDQVCVSEDPLYCLGWTGLQTADQETGIRAVNPFGGYLKLHTENGLRSQAVLHLHDAVGRIVLTGIWPQGQRTMLLPAHDLPVGGYFLRLLPENGPPATIKLTHVSP